MMITMDPDLFQRLNDPYLDGMRSIADDAFDLAVESALAQDKSEVYSILQAIEDNASLPDALLQSPFEKLALPWTTLPAWADPERIAAGQDLFEEYTSEIMMLLGALSLPYCYAAAKGATVLYLSEKIRKNTHQRLIDTSGFVWDVLDRQAFSVGGRGWAAIFKTRIIHAMVRVFVRKNPAWDTPGEVPINQEDMAGTNLAFSYMVLHGLEKMGHNVPQIQKEGFLHLWNVISHALGLDRLLLPANMKEAYWLERAIRQRQFRSSKEGRELAAGLLRYYKKTVPNPILQPLIPAQMAYLLGDEVAGILGIRPSKMKSATLAAMMRTLQWTNRLRPHTSTRAEAEENRRRLQHLA
jgi:hypothetical protein